MQLLKDTHRSTSAYFSSGDISGVVYQPLDHPPTRILVYYHGWSSSVEQSLFRGQILSQRGDVIILPEVKYHGERGSMAYTPETMAAHFWEVVIQTVEEFATLSEWIEQRFDLARDKLAVLGHSMGGFTVGGILTQYPWVSCGVAYNASFDWAATNRLAEERLQPVEDAYGPLPIACINAYDPIDDAKALSKRAILLTNGGEDNTVPVQGNLSFMERIRPYMDGTGQVEHIVYDFLGHVMTDRMLFDGLNFIEAHL